MYEEHLITEQFQFSEAVIFNRNIIDKWPGF